MIYHYTYENNILVFSTIRGLGLDFIIDEGTFKGDWKNVQNETAYKNRKTFFIVKISFVKHIIKSSADSGKPIYLHVIHYVKIVIRILYYTRTADERAYNIILNVKLLWLVYNMEYW